MSKKDSINVEEMLESASDEIAAVIKSLGHPKRLIVIKALWSEPSPFIDLQKATGLSKTALVHHLDKLVENGIVNRLERGIYELTGDGAELVFDALTHPLKHGFGDRAQFLLDYR